MRAGDQKLRYDLEWPYDPRKFTLGGLIALLALCRKGSSIAGGQHWMIDNSWAGDY